MARWEQYEVRAQNGTMWRTVGAFMDLEVATAVAHARHERVRVIRVIFEDSTRLQEELLVEIGNTRKAG
jgi:hypothetical protein